VKLNVVGGTDRQRGWFAEAMDACLFPWERITTHVTVEWVDPLDLPQHYFAYTTWNGTPADSCGHPDVALVQIINTLDDPDRPGTDGGHPTGYFAGKRFYTETVIHELGHVVQMKFSERQRETICDLYGTDLGDWSEPPAWVDKVEEGDAETFKDVWLPRAYRKFNNRTYYRLEESRFEDYLTVLDGVCPCGDDPGIN
jgi:hypothetical protein